MCIPTATYRVQFRNGMTFDRLTTHISYLKQLGISHLYASPIFTATDGSSHGYDVTDANEIDPAIGGRAGFDRMVDALKAEGLGLILDIVPNHMAASLENRWWYDVVENGPASAYSGHFDIDWSRRLTLPVLDTSFEAALEGNEIGVGRDPSTGKPSLTYRGSFFPLAPYSYAGRSEEIMKAADRETIAALHDEQAYQLIPWRDVPRALSYRRFFEIAGLVGVRVEDRQVFDDTHRLILELVRSGAVQGLRIDHVDGLTDPKAYLDRLRAAVGPDCYLTVEKILGDDETLPADWPVSGTTGYEFISAISDALVDGDNVGRLRQRYEALTGHSVDGSADVHAAKRLLLEKNFVGELTRLGDLVLEAAEIERYDMAELERSARAAVTELLIAFPRYRTYGTETGLTSEDADLLETARSTIQVEDGSPISQALDVGLRLLKGSVSVDARPVAASFRTRFQQLTGPLMAKSVEDTVFFRDNAVLALNEVGSEAAQAQFSIERFHEKMRMRARHWPHALSATSTHDTKRGEDARARLYALTEMPDVWAQAVDRWQSMNSGALANAEKSRAPEPNVEWMLYQALAGVWPVETGVADAASLKALEERFIPYVEKALREAKLRTSWLEPDEDYEASVIAYARHLLSPDNRRFLEDFTETIVPLARAGFVNSLSQTVIKLMAPGVPDVYQGSEALDLSLVDPDNRRLPDFASLDSNLATAEVTNLDLSDPGSWARLKQALVARLLTLRRDDPGLFATGAYTPLAASGAAADAVIAFARTDGARAVIIAGPRLVGRTLRQQSIVGLPELLSDVEISLPTPLADRRYRDLWSGRSRFVGNSIQAIAEASPVPFLVLVSDEPAA
ncbi:malto-oligosyltrehalose synthase [Peteryoungia ipomoeae]|uniref:Malto-oligosyltrehalose synthase n=1 Tax=Peteryoungia ipomoeae TaxID=1210932 RepID=A0A4S8P4Z4_9HYPH|nr:malto-oligosyltrehalose synthase [Peteryoungia ipomoeae]THV25200.1 malto-oligosyltrehalose synthase [Peteryoungia ipomoeae]